jgi:hypothetical protein
MKPELVVAVNFLTWTRDNCARSSMMGHARTNRQGPDVVAALPVLFRRSHERSRRWAPDRLIRRRVLSDGCPPSAGSRRHRTPATGPVYFVFELLYLDCDNVAAQPLICTIASRYACVQYPLATALQRFPRRRGALPREGCAMSLEGIVSILGDICVCRGAAGARKLGARISRNVSLPVRFTGALARIFGSGRVAQVRHLGNGLRYSRHPDRVQISPLQH